MAEGKMCSVDENAGLERECWVEWKLLWFAA
jgi:hypothetical protein